MSWLAYALATVALWTGWSFLGKLALKTATPFQATIVFGVAAVVVGAVALISGQRGLSWSPSAMWLALVSGTCGALGLVTFYLALERGKASLVAPIVGLYPAIVAILSLLLLSERLSGLQMAGVVLAVAGIMLLGGGG